MNHLNYEFDASQGDIAEVTLDRAAIVLMIDPANCDDYDHGCDYRYYGDCRKEIGLFSRK